MSKLTVFEDRVVYLDDKFVGRIDRLTYRRHGKVSRVKPTIFFAPKGEDMTDLTRRVTIREPLYVVGPEGYQINPDFVAAIKAAA